MKTNLTIMPNSTSFKANIDDKFLAAADNYFQKSGTSVEYKQYCSALKRFSDMPDTNNIGIYYKQRHKGGVVEHMLYAFEEDNMRAVVLTAKDKFRKLIKKFSFMSEHEFKSKMGYLKK